MFDIGISELGMIGVVALIVLGPERLPRVARTVGTLLGRAQRYLADVKSEVNRQMDLTELRSMKEGFESSVREMQGEVARNAGEIHQEFESAWKDATAGLHGEPGAEPSDAVQGPTPYLIDVPSAKRLKRSTGHALPLWYRRQARVRTRALSGAARVARHRPHR